MTGYGSMVVDEYVLPIVDIYLAHGEINFVAKITGPHGAVRDAAATVYGRDGRVIVRSNPRCPIEWDAAPGDGRHLTVVLPVRCNPADDPDRLGDHT